MKQSADSLRFKIKSIFLALGCSYFLAVIYLAVREQFFNYWTAGEVLLGNGLMIGGDFPIFYIAGKLFREARSELYNLQLQLDSLRALYSGTSFKNIWLVFVYPPPVAAMFSLFSNFSLLNGYLAWLSTSVIIFAASSYLVISKLSLSRIEKLFIFLTGIGFVPFLMNCLGAGQLGVLGLLIFSFALVARRKGNEWLEGICLGFGFYKPPLFVFLGVLAIIEKRWKVVFGGAISGGLLLLYSYFLIGGTQLLNYFTVAPNYRYGQELPDGVSLPPFRGVGLYALLNQSSLDKGLVYAVYLVIFVLGIHTIKTLKTRSDLNHELKELIFAAEISLSVFFSVQCINYDLTLILPALYVVLGYLISRPASVMRIILILVFSLFHTEWMIRTNRSGVEYSPIVPMLLLAWSIAVIGTVKAELSHSKR